MGDARIKVVAMELAFAVRAQWGMVAVTACPWRVRSPDGSLDVLRIPDVLAGPLPRDDPGPFRGSPELVAEVWSPADGYDQVQRARSEYWLGGAGVLIEADVDAAGEVRLEWYVRDPAGGWSPQASATGDTELTVLFPRPFAVVANRLLHPEASSPTP